MRHEVFHYAGAVLFFVHARIAVHKVYISYVSAVQRPFMRVVYKRCVPVIFKAFGVERVPFVRQYGGIILGKYMVLGRVPYFVANNAVHAFARAHVQRNVLPYAVFICAAYCAVIAFDLLNEQYAHAAFAHAVLKLSKESFRIERKAPFQRAKRGVYGA